jgi:hypothetical protein
MVTVYVIVSPGRAELSLLSGYTAPFVEVTLWAETNAAGIMRSATATRIESGRLRGERFGFKAGVLKQAADLIGLVFK